MDCNIQCCTLVIFVALAATLAYSSARICAPGVKTDGFTEPQGDILLSLGQPLEINCTIGPFSNYNSSFLRFNGQGKEIDSSYVNIINSTTIRLYLPNPQIQEAFYTCNLKTDDGIKGVCLNKVIVGYSPQNVTNFSCTSLNWNDLNCSWVLPQNFIKTRYNLGFYVHQIRYDCPEVITNADNTVSSCYWNLTSTPTYRQVYETYIFILDATNALGNNSWKFVVNNFAAVVPDPPMNLSVTGSSVDSISLEWFIPLGLDNFPPGLIHKLEYKNIFEDWQDVSTKSLCISKCPKGYKFELSNVKYHNTIYHIKVYGRSAKVENTRWSEPAYITYRTPPTIPAGPPRTVMGSFEVSSTNISFRDVYLYWQEIPKHWENGDSFKYKILTEEDGIAKDINASHISNFYACFHILSNKEYRFKVVSENIVGTSINYSEIIVPAEDNILPLPEQVTQIPFNSDTYQLSWKPVRNVTVNSYTVFWCKNKSDRPYQCSGGLNWIVVPGGFNSKKVSNLTDVQVYQFGVSANSGELSSGIVWASCTVLPGKGSGRMKSVNFIHVGPTYLYISWKLECSNQIGIVSGFHIDYCGLNSSCATEQCNASEKCLHSGEIDVEDERTTYNITGLKPYTNYSVSISVKSDKAKGVTSVPKIERTGEDVPDLIKSVNISNITNTSAVLNWTPPENNNGILCDYIIRWGDESKRVGINENNGYILQELESSMHYNITVSGCTSKGCGKPSAAVSLVTRIGRPRAPTSIQLGYNNSSKVATWLHPLGSAGDRTYYTVRFQVLSDGKLKFDYEVNTSTNTAVLPWDKCESDGLATYNLSVRATNILKDGTVLEGPWSKPQKDHCLISTPPPHLTVVIPLVAVLLSLVLCIFCALFSQHLWVKFNRMRDISVKMPARLSTRPEDNSENHTIHIWNNHVVREAENHIYRPSPDEQSEAIELIQEDASTDRESFGCDVIQNSAVFDGNTVPVVEAAETIPTVSPSPGYIKLAPSQPSSGYVTIPPLVKGYMMATLPPSPNPVSPSAQCSISSLKQNNLNSFNPKPFNSFPEPNHFGDNNMISPINST